MKNNNLLKAERRKRIVEILAKGLSRCVDSADKSTNISGIEGSKISRTVAYEVDIHQDKSVSESHENERHR
jgi:hypothetical protein